MARGNYDLMELIRKKSSMSAEISKKDPDYSQYSGGSLEISSKIALIDTILKERVLPETLTPLVKLFRSFLVQQRKAFFASVGSTEITKLGFIQGDPREIRNATAIYNENNP